MKLDPIQRRPSAHGFVTLAVLAMIVLMGILLVINIGTVKTAFREVRLVEQRQLRHHPWLATNVVTRGTTARAVSQ